MISNLTYWDGINLLGFDTGPGNCLLLNCKKYTNEEFDKMESYHLLER